MTKRQSLRTELSTLRTEPGRSRLSLLLCVLCVSSLLLISTINHTERTVTSAIARDQAAFQASGLELLEDTIGDIHLAQSKMVGWIREVTQ